MEYKEKIQGNVYVRDDDSDYCQSRLLIQGEKEVFDLEDCLVGFEGKNVSIEITIRES